jgi:hypothetical protein
MRTQRHTHKVVRLFRPEKLPTATDVIWLSLRRLDVVTRKKEKGEIIRSWWMQPRERFV